MNEKQTSVPGVSISIPLELPTLSLRQAQLLKALGQYFLDHRTYPTHRELASIIGLRGSPAAYLLALQIKGYLETQPRARRNVKITELGWEYLRMMIEPKLIRPNHKRQRLSTTPTVTSLQQL
jgi:hypothetical protein